MELREVKVDAGKTDRPAGPICIPLNTKILPWGSLIGLVDTSTGKRLVGQISSDGVLCWWAEPLKAKQTRVYKLDAAAAVADAPRVLIDPTHPDQVHVWIDGEQFTTYNFGSDAPRPYLYPLIGPTGQPVTRNFPMRTDVPGETTDHKHHRSCWVAWGDVNGVDHWSESKGCGLQHHRRFGVCSSGPVFGRIEAVIDWLTPDKKRQLTEHRSLVFYRTPPGLRMFDLIVRFVFTDGDVKFGDTKEGGICAIRVATTMDGNKGGQIRNSRGGVGEKECWGKPAEWCDYVGPVGGQTVGIAVMDAPTNFRHPTPWHIRDYGLFAANPFGLSYFQRDKTIDGSHTFKAGQVATFRYRVLIHKGSTAEANIAGHYANFADPPKVELA